jgi:hypothetical protein
MMEYLNLSDILKIRFKNAYSMTNVNHLTVPGLMLATGNESSPKGLGFSLPAGRGLSMTLLCSNLLMENWKNENPTPIFCNLEHKPSRFSEA